MPENPVLAAASAIFSAGQIITSAQVVSIFENVEDESNENVSRQAVRMRTISE